MRTLREHKENTKRTLRKLQEQNSLLSTFKNNTFRSQGTSGAWECLFKFNNSLKTSVTFSLSIPNRYMYCKYETFSISIKSVINLIYYL